MVNLDVSYRKITDKEGNTFGNETGKKSVKITGKRMITWQSHGAEPLVHRESNVAGVGGVK